MSKLLYTDVPQYPVPKSGQTIEIEEAFRQQLKEARELIISTGYFSRTSLEELDRLLRLPENRLGRVTLLLGMAAKEGVSKADHSFLGKLNSRWKNEGIGEILVPRQGANHEKVFLFYRSSETTGSLYPFSAILGSANFSFLKKGGFKRNQYETAVLLNADQDPSDTGILLELDRQEHEILRRSLNFSEADLRIISRSPAPRTAFRKELMNMDSVDELTPDEVSVYRRRIQKKFHLPLKVPGFAERKSKKSGGKSWTRSNINVCFAKPRTPGKSRDWYEMQLCVNSEILKDPEYPSSGRPFLIVTDDGYKFPAHATSQNHKQLSAVGNEKIMGRWLKGRLVEAGLVFPQDPKEDTEKLSMITREMLEEYGADHLLLASTGKKEADKNGNLLDVWYLSFDPDEVNET